MMRRFAALFGVFVLLCTPRTASADWLDRFVHVVCVPQYGYFELRPVAIYNVGDSVEQHSKAVEDEYGLFEARPFETECRVGEKTIKAKIYYTTPQGRGMCGASIKGAVSIWLDELLVADRISFDDQCWGKTAHRIWFEVSREFQAIYLDYEPEQGRDGPFRQNVTMNFPVGLANQSKGLPMTRESLEDELKRKMQIYERD